MLGAMADRRSNAARTHTATEEAAIVEAMRDGGVRDVALLAAGLSQDSLEHVRQPLEHVRSLEGLPPVSDTAVRSRAATSADFLR